MTLSPILKTVPMSPHLVAERDQNGVWFKIFRKNDGSLFGTIRGSGAFSLRGIPDFLSPNNLEAARRFLQPDRSYFKREGMEIMVYPKMLGGGCCQSSELAESEREPLLPHRDQDNALPVVKMASALMRYVRGRDVNILVDKVTELYKEFKTGEFPKNPFVLVLPLIDAISSEDAARLSIQCRRMCGKVLVAVVNRAMLSVIVQEELREPLNELKPKIIERLEKVLSILGDKDSHEIVLRCQLETVIEAMTRVSEICADAGRGEATKSLSQTAWHACNSVTPDFAVALQIIKGLAAAEPLPSWYITLYFIEIFRPLFGQSKEILAEAQKLYLIHDNWLFLSAMCFNAYIIAVSNVSPEIQKEAFASFKQFVSYMGPKDYAANSRVRNIALYHLKEIAEHPDEVIKEQALELILERLVFEADETARKHLETFNAFPEIKNAWRALLAEKNYQKIIEDKKRGISAALAQLEAKKETMASAEYADEKEVYELMNEVCLLQESQLKVIILFVGPETKETP